MAEQHYFQIPAFQYIDDPFRIGKIGVAFEFHIIPDGNDASIFRTKVLFSIPWLAAVGKQFVGNRAFLLPEERNAGSRFFRYAFARLKNQLEAGNLTNHNDVVIVQAEAEQFQRGIAKQCDFLASNGKGLFCYGDIRNPIETSTKICEQCILPEPVRRCDNLRIQETVYSKDSQGKYQITPECYCIDGNTIPSGTEPCVGFSGNEPDCWIPLKFYLQSPPKPPIGFRTKSS